MKSKQSEAAAALPSSASVAEAIAVAEAAKTSAEARVTNLTADYRAALTTGTDAVVQTMEGDLVEAQGQVERYALRVTELTALHAEAQQREREAAAQARLDALEARRDAMDVKLQELRAEVESEYVAAARQIAEFIERWGAVRTEALQLDQALTAAGVQPSPTSRLLFGGKDPNRRVPEQTIVEQRWVTSDGRGGYDPVHQFEIRENGERVPAFGVAGELRTFTRKEPAYIAQGQVVQPTYDFGALHLPSPRRFEPAILAAKGRAQ